MDKQNAKHVLTLLVMEMKEQELMTRVKSYGSIVAILERLGEIATREKHLIMLYKNELLWHCESLCGLTDGNGHDDDKHIVWALSVINKIFSPHCFKN